MPVTKVLGTVRRYYDSQQESSMNPSAANHLRAIAMTVITALVSNIEQCPKKMICATDEEACGICK